MKTDDDLSAALLILAGVVKRVLDDPKKGFALFVFDFEGAAAKLITNGEPDDVKRAVRLWLDEPESSRRFVEPPKPN